MVGNIAAKLKALAGVIKANLTEIYTTVLIVFGLPLVAYIYTSLKLAVTVFIVVNIALGVFALRSAN